MRFFLFFGVSLCGVLGGFLLMNRYWHMDVRFLGRRLVLAVSKSMMVGWFFWFMIMCFGGWLSSPWSRCVLSSL